MEIVYSITAAVLVLLFIAMLISMVAKHQAQSLEDDILDSEHPLHDERIDPEPQGLHSTAYANGDVVIHEPPIQPLKQSDLEY